MNDEIDPMRDRDLRAAELAIGLLDGAEAAAAREELLADPAFRASHEYWSVIAGTWFDELRPEEPDTDLWPAIEAAIDAEEAPATERSNGRGPWFGWALAATVAAVLLGTTALIFYQREAAMRDTNAALTQRLAKAEGERQVAQITGEADRVLVSAMYEPASGEIRVRLDLPAEPRLVPELWVIPGDGKPRSLGIFASTDARIEVVPALRQFLIDGATLAVTLESEQGAPHAAPTGPILGTTELREI